MYKRQLSSGVPLLASALPGVRTVVENGRTGFTFEVGNRAGLAARLKAVLEDEPLRRRMSAAAREAALAKYEQGAVWAAVERTFKRAAEGRSS